MSKTVKIIRQVRREITRLIPIAGRWIFSVYDEGYRAWREFGPYNRNEAKKNRKAIFRQKVLCRLNEKVF